MSEPQVGRFRTAPTERRSISFVWSGDTAAGLGHRRSARRHAHLLDHAAVAGRISSSIPATTSMPIVRFPRNRSFRTAKSGRTSSREEKSKVAQTLADFRGNYKYNLLDRNLRAFNAEVPMFAQWDDHEVTNDWCPGVALGWDGYADKSMLKLVGARLPRLPRIHADARDAGGSRADLSQDSLRPAARRLHARHALLPHPVGEDGAPPQSWGRPRPPGSSAN